MRSFGREFSILNMLAYGSRRNSTRRNVIRDNQLEGKEKKNGSAIFIKTHSLHRWDRQKQQKSTRESMERSFRKSLPSKMPRKWRMVLFSALLIVWAFTFWIRSTDVPRHIFNGGRAQQRIFRAKWQQSEAETSSDQVIAVTYPYVPEESDGGPVASQVILQHVFANVWNEPFIVEYKPPENVTFDTVVLTLDTNIKGRQYDRLAHLFLNDICIWRTSTIEPHGSNETTYSTFKKDVTQYLKVFQEEGQIKYQLNNIVTDSLIGAFDITIRVDYFDSKPEKTKGDSDPYEFLTPKSSADRVFPLVSPSDGRKPPLIDLPSQNFTVSLPQLNRNVTHLTLSVFTSGNGNEEFWYTNVVDAYADTFKGLYEAHGPMRFVNVYVNGKKVSCIAPTPVIYTGGLSPSLWSAVVSIGAFDVPVIDIDFTPLLPLLWSESGKEENQLHIEVSNGLDEIFSKTSGIGKDWITTANLLVYESDQVADASGHIIDISASKSGNAIWYGKDKESTVGQVVNGHFGTHLASQLNFDLTDGSSLNSTYTTYTDTGISNVQQITENGNRQKVVHSPFTTFSSSIYNNLSNSEIVHYELEEGHPMVLDTFSASEDQDTIIEIALAIADQREEHFNDGSVKIVSTGQNGTSDFVVSDSGNHGTAEIDTIYRHKSVEGSDFSCYERRVQAENSTRVSDHSNETGSEDGLTDCNYVFPFESVFSSQAVDQSDWSLITRKLDQIIDDAGIAGSLKDVLEVFGKHTEEVHSYDGELAERSTLPDDVALGAISRKNTF